jgi:hypothetical protein
MNWISRTRCTKFPRNPITQLGYRVRSRFYRRSMAKKRNKTETSLMWKVHARPYEEEKYEC